MPDGRWHDFRCGCCDVVYRDVLVVHALSAMTAPLFCAQCGSLLVWIPKVGRMDAYEPFQEFETSVQKPGGGTEVVHIDSLRKLRQVERESEQRSRNGEGQPLVWRDYAQDVSNHDVHTLGVDPGKQAFDDLQARRRASRQAPVKEVFAEGEAPAMGPGAHEISPLDSL